MMSEDDSGQRKPNEDEREHLKWITDRTDAISKLCTDIPYSTALKIISIAQEIEGAAFDPFGDILATCEICSEQILTCDDDAVSGEDGWFCATCSNPVQLATGHNLTPPSRSYGSMKG